MRSLAEQRPPVPPHPPEAPAPLDVAPRPAAAATASVQPPPPVPTSANANAGVEVRRLDVRARFDALFDRLLAVEDTLDAFGKRFQLRAAHDRRQDQRLLERLETTAEVVERQALTLEALVSTLERIEQRVERVERWLRTDGSGRETGTRESRTVAPRSELDTFDELEQGFVSEHTGSRSVPPDALEAWDAAPFSNSSFRGNLAEMSLPTVLAMLELERRTGVLKVSAEDGSVVSATLRDGAVVGARVREVESDAVEAVREAMRFNHGHFWFRQSGVEVVSGPPRSVGSVLLEASRRNDEAVRSA